MQIDHILTAAVRGGASDVILKIGALPRFRFNGNLVPLGNGKPVKVEEMTAWVQQVLAPRKLPDTAAIDFDLAYQNKDGHRFRVNIFRQRGQLGMVLRVILAHIRTLEELQLPKVIAKIVQERRGLVLVTGATGSGKSTTLAAMIDRVNQERSEHIVTIEDPIEYLFQDKNCVIEQREIGLDTATFPSALVAAMRQNPDVIMVGELRDQITVRTALQAAETGHLVLATMHTTDAAESVIRILSLFDPHEQEGVRLVLSQILRAVISQRLVTRRDGVGMIAAVEVMIGNAMVRDVIAKGDIHRLHDIIDEGRDAWEMQSFDQALIGLCQSGLISIAEALKNSTSRGNMELRLSGVSQST